MQARDLYKRVVDGLRNRAIEIGRLLIAAKARVPRGQWIATVRAHWPWGEDTAEQLASIAAHAVIGDPNSDHAGNLPPDVATRARLAQLHPPELVPMLGREVTQDISREKAASIVRATKLRRKAVAEAERRRKKGLPPKPPAPTGDDAKALAAERKRQREERLAAIATISEDDLEALGPLASREHDLFEFTRLTREAQVGVIAAVSAGANTIKAALDLWDVARGRLQTDRAGFVLPTRIMAAMLRQADILQPVISLLGQLITATKRAQGQLQELVDEHRADPKTLGRAPALLGQAKLDELETWKRSLSFQVPAVTCPTCDGAGVVVVQVDGGETARACTDCREAGWIDMATKRKRESDRETAATMRGRS